MNMMVTDRGLHSFVAVEVSNGKSEAEPANVKVPFDFVVGDRVLRAGIYELGEGEKPGLVRFRSPASANDEILVQTINYSRTESTLPEILVEQNTYYLGLALMGTACGGRKAVQ
jgi:hypothetical protein